MNYSEVERVLREAVEDGNLYSGDVDILLSEWEEVTYPKFVIYEVSTPAHNYDQKQVATICGKVDFAGWPTFKPFDSYREAKEEKDKRFIDTEYWYYVIMPVRNPKDMKRLIEASS